MRTCAVVLVLVATVVPAGAERVGTGFTYAYTERVRHDPETGRMRFEQEYTVEAVACGSAADKADIRVGDILSPDMFNFGKVADTDYDSPHMTITLVRRVGTHTQSMTKVLTLEQFDDSPDNMLCGREHQRL